MMKSVLLSWHKSETVASTSILLLLLVAINGVVLYNAWHHDPLVGYDAPDHAAYLLTLANGRLPTPNDSFEFFSPLLPYLLPAVARGLGGLPTAAALRFALLLNSLLSIGVTVTLVTLAQRLRPQQPWVAVATLALLGMLPVYYKTFAFIRGEPYVLLFGLLLLINLLKPTAATATGRIRQAAGQGVVLGFAILSRQWAFFFFPVVALHTVLAWGEQRQKAPARHHYRLGVVARWQPLLPPPLREGLLTAAIAFLVGGWFYLHLYHNYGSITAFNRNPASQFTLTNQPPDFYTGLGDGYLFTDPVRPHFANQLLPKFYSELWGDHEAYFVVMGQDWRNGRYRPGWKLEKAVGKEWLTTNRAAMGAYLGWVNRIALLPTAVLLLGFLWGLGQTAHWLRRFHWQPPPAAVTLWLTVAISVAGYLWFLILYPNTEKGDTIKATYLLHIFPLLTLLATLAMEKLPNWVRWLVWLGLGGTVVYLAPLFLTHYPVG